MAVRAREEDVSPAAIGTVERGRLKVLSYSDETNTNVEQEEREQRSNGTSRYQRRGT